MRPRLTRRRIAFLGVIAWIAIVHWFWTAAVPLLPTTSIPLKPNQRYSHILANGLAAITHKIPGPEPDEWITTGPVQLWDIGRASLVREILSEADRPYGLLLQQTLIPARRGEDMSLFSPDTGEPVFMVSAEGVKQIAAGFESDQVVGILKDDTLSIRDLVSGKELWSQSNIAAGFGFTAPGLIETFETDEKLLHARGVWRSTRTGELHPELATVMSIAWKGARGALVICESLDDGAAETFVYDIDERRRLWTMPNDGAYFFSKDGRSICHCGSDGNAIQISRRDPQTGSLQSGASADERIKTFGRLYGDDQFVLVGIDHREEPIWQFSEWLRNRSPFHFQSLLPSSSWEIHEVAGGKRLGWIQYEGTYQTEDPNWIVDGTPEAVHFYGFPPRRNWLWLIGWALGPILTLAAIRFLANLRRPRRPGSSAPEQSSTIA